VHLVGFIIGKLVTMDGHINAKKNLHLSSAVETRHSFETMRCCRQQYIRHSALKNSLFMLTVNNQINVYIRSIITPSFRFHTLHTLEYRPMLLVFIITYLSVVMYHYMSIKL
jgi:hypothetical protein